jgi:ribosomal 50S subunit-recycling heat shock protein
VEALQRRVANVTLGRLPRTVIVRDVAERRVSAAEAEKLYEETE